MTSFAVTAATGQLGSLAVTALIEHGVPASDIVAVARHTDKAAELAARGVQVRQGDYDDSSSMTAALQGVDRVLLISSPTVGQRATQHRNVIDAAEAAGVQRLVYTSLAKADSNSMPLGEEHRTTERMLAESPLDSVIVRNGWYLENYTESLDQYRAQGGIIGAVGQATINAATRRDYAAAAAAVLTAESNVKTVYELGGAGFTMSALAETLSAATGTQLGYTNVSLEDFEAGLLQAGLDQGTAAFVTALEAGTAAGDLEVPGHDLADLLGHPVEDLSTSLTRLLG